MPGQETAAQTVYIGRGPGSLLFPSRLPETTRILAFHGGGVDGAPDMLAPFCARLAARGDITVLAAGYRTPERDGAGLEDMLADAEQALEWCRADLPPGAELYLFGASFGGLLALHAAVEAPGGIAGLILMNPVTDIGPGTFPDEVVPDARLVGLSPLQRHAASPIVGRLRCFIAHGDADTVVPLASSQGFARLWPASRCEIKVFPGAGHGFFTQPPHSEQAAAAVLDFVAAPERPRPARRKAGGLPGGTTLVYGIGAQKAGTSWLYEFLAGHPDCHCPELKELHYFDVIHPPHENRHHARRVKALQSLSARLAETPEPANQRILDQIARLVEWLCIHSGPPGDHGPYLSYLMRGHAGQKLACDITPSYAVLDRAGFADMDSLGPAKFVFILRDPVGRLWSQIRMMVEGKGIDPDGPDYAPACIARARHLVKSGRLPTLLRAHYERTLTELEAVVPRDRIHTIFYEDMFRQESVSALCAFLGIADRPAETDKRVNLGNPLPIPGEIETMLLEGLQRHYEDAFARFGDAVPQAWRDRYAGLGRTRPGLVGRLLGR
ncbi:serine aminopeptidase domain-containing protein [Roseicyclus persicicus]|nr:alpha/beta hydrolase [Roseibacterium persicicum]